MPRLFEFFLSFSEIEVWQGYILKEKPYRVSVALIKHIQHKTVINLMPLCEQKEKLYTQPVTKVWQLVCSVFDLYNLVEYWATVFFICWITLH